jgi:hypothetical protein
MITILPERDPLSLIFAALPSSSPLYFTTPWRPLAMTTETFLWKKTNRRTRDLGPSVSGSSADDLPMLDTDALQCQV